jgi:hypothetical protein
VELTLNPGEDEETGVSSQMKMSLRCMVARQEAGVEEEVDGAGPRLNEEAGPSVDDLWWMTGIPNEITKAMKIGENLFP